MMKGGSSQSGAARADLFPPWAAVLVLLVAIPFGLFVPEIWRLALAATGVIAVAVMAGPTALLYLILLTSGISFAQATEGEKSLLASLGGINVDGLRLLTVLAATAALAVITPTILRGLRHQAVYLVLLGLGFASLFWTTSLIDGARLEAKLVYPLIGFALAYHASMVGKGRIVKTSVIAAVILTSLVGVAIAIFTGSWDSVDSPGRYRGSLSFSTYGLFCSMTGIAAYAYWCEKQERLVGFLFLASAAQVVATGTRAAAIALAFGLVVVAIGSKRIWSVLLILGVGVAAWVLIPTLGERTASMGFERGAADTQEIVERLNFSGRLIVWKDVWESMVVGGGVLGAGLGATTPFLASRYFHAGVVHNEYLRILAELGPVGLLLFLGTYVGMLVTLIGVAVREPGARQAAVLASGAIFAFGAASVTDNSLDYYSFFSLFPWVFSGLAMGLHDRMAGTAKQC